MYVLGGSFPKRDAYIPVLVLLLLGRCEGDRFKVGMYTSTLLRADTDGTVNFKIRGTLSEHEEALVPQPEMKLGALDFFFFTTPAKIGNVVDIDIIQYDTGSSWRATLITLENTDTGELTVFEWPDPGCTFLEGANGCDVITLSPLTKVELKSKGIAGHYMRKTTRAKLRVVDTLSSRGRLQCGMACSRNEACYAFQSDGATCTLLNQYDPWDTTQAQTEIWTALFSLP